MYKINVRQKTRFRYVSGEIYSYTKMIDTVYYKKIGL